MTVIEEIQLDAYALPDEHQVVKCFPGEGYKFYDVVEREEVVFLDIRGLDELPDNPAAWDEDALRRVVEFDYVTRHAPKRGRRGPRKRKSGIPQRNVHFIEGLLLGLRRGDLVIVPPPGYRRNVLIGEIMDDPGRPVRVEAQDREHTYTYLGRKVKWRASVEKRLLRRALLDKLHTAQAYFPIGLSLHEDVYAIAYQNYVWRGTFVATFETSKEHFTSSDTLVTSLWLNGLAATKEAAEASKPLEGKTFVEAAIRPLAAGNALELNINSPGTILVRSATAFALATMTLLPLSANEAQQVADGTARVTLKAVGGSNPDCQLQVEAAVADYVRSLGPQRLLEQCEFASRSRNEATLTTRARLIRPTGRRR